MATALFAARIGDLSRRPHPPAPGTHDRAGGITWIRADGHRDGHRRRGSEAAGDGGHRGLVSSTLLTLFVLPALYALLGGESRLARDDLEFSRRPPLGDVEQAAE